MKYKISLVDTVQISALVNYDVEYDTETKQAQIVGPGSTSSQDLSPYEIVRGLADLNIINFVNLLRRMPDPRQLPVQAEIDRTNETVLEIATRGPSFQFGGISSNNKAFEVMLESIVTEGIERLPEGSVDAACWENKRERFFPFEGGVFSDSEPAVLRAKAFVNSEKPPLLDMVFWGL